MDFSRYVIKIWITPIRKDGEKIYNLTPELINEAAGLMNSVELIVTNQSGTIDINWDELVAEAVFNSAEDWREAIDLLKGWAGKGAYHFKIEWWTEDVTQRDEGVWESDYPTYIPDVEFEED